MIVLGDLIGVCVVILTVLCDMYQGTDQSYVDKLNANFAKNQYFTKWPQSNKPVFSISHYAGKVTRLHSLLTLFLRRASLRCIFLRAHACRAQRITVALSARG